MNASHIQRRILEPKPDDHLNKNVFLFVVFSRAISGLFGEAGGAVLLYVGGGMCVMDGRLTYQVRQ